MELSCTYQEDLKMYVAKAIFEAFSTFYLLLITF